MIRRDSSRKTPSAVNAAENEVLKPSGGISVNAGPESLATVVDACNFRLRDDGSFALRRPDILLASFGRAAYPLKDGSHVLAVDASGHLSVMDGASSAAAEGVYLKVNLIDGTSSYLAPDAYDAKIIAEGASVTGTPSIAISSSAVPIRTGDSTLIPVLMYKSVAADATDAGLYALSDRYLPRFLSVYFDEARNGWVAELREPEVVTIPTSAQESPMKPNLALDNPYALRDLYGYGAPAVTAIVPYLQPSGSFSVSYTSRESFSGTVNELQALFQIYAWKAYGSTKLNVRVVARHSLCFEDPATLFPSGTAGISGAAPAIRYPEFDSNLDQRGGYLIEAHVGSFANGIRFRFPAYVPKGASFMGSLDLESESAFAETLALAFESDIIDVYALQDGESASAFSKANALRLPGSALQKSISLSRHSVGAMSGVYYYIGGLHESLGVNIVCLKGSFEMVADPWANSGYRALGVAPGLSGVPVSGLSMSNAGKKLARFSGAYPCSIAWSEITAASSPAPGVRVKNVLENVSDPSYTGAFSMVTELSPNASGVLWLKAMVATPSASPSGYYCRWERSSDGGATWGESPEFVALHRGESDFIKIPIHDAGAGEESLDSAGEYVSYVRVLPFSRIASNDDLVSNRPDFLPINASDSRLQYRFRIFKRASSSTSSATGSSGAFPEKGIAPCFPVSGARSRTLFPRSADGSVFYASTKPDNASAQAAEANTWAFGFDSNDVGVCRVPGDGDWVSGSVGLAFSESEAGIPPDTFGEQVAAASATPRDLATWSTSPTLAISANSRSRGAYIRLTESGIDGATCLISVQFLHSGANPFQGSRLNNNTTSGNLFPQGTLALPSVDVKAFDCEASAYLIGMADGGSDSADVGNGDMSVMHALVDAIRITRDDWYYPIGTEGYSLVNINADDVYSALPSNTYKVCSARISGGKPINASSAMPLDVAYCDGMLALANSVLGSGFVAPTSRHVAALDLSLAVSKTKLYSDACAFSEHATTGDLRYIQSISPTLAASSGKKAFDAGYESIRIYPLYKQWKALAKALPTSALPLGCAGGDIRIPRGYYAPTTETGTAVVDTERRLIASAVWLSRIVVEVDTHAEFEIKNPCDFPMRYLFKASSEGYASYPHFDYANPLGPESDSKYKNRDSDGDVQTADSDQQYGLHLSMKGIRMRISAGGSSKEFDADSSELNAFEPSVSLDIPANGSLTVQVDVRVYGIYADVKNLFLSRCGSVKEVTNADFFQNYDCQTIPNDAETSAIYHVDEAAYSIGLYANMVPYFSLRSAAGSLVFGAPASKKAYWYGMDRGVNDQSGVGSGITPATPTSSARMGYPDYVTHAAPNDVGKLWQSPGDAAALKAALSQPYDEGNAVELSFMHFMGMSGSETEAVDYSRVGVAGGKLIYHEGRVLAYNVKNHGGSLFVSDPDSLYFPLQNEITFGYGSDVTAVIPWRDYVIVFTENSTYMLLKDASAPSGFSVRTVNPQIGVPKSDGPSVQAILNGILFKSGGQAYVYVPGRYSTVDTMLNIRRISDAVDGFLIEGAEVLSYVQDDEWHVFQRTGESSSSELVYDYAKNAWIRNSHSVFPDDSFSHGTSWRMLVAGRKDLLSCGKSAESLRITDSDSEFYDLSPLADSTRGDYLNGDPLLKFISDRDGDVASGLSSFDSGTQPIPYVIDTGQKSSRFTVSKQFIEVKLNLMSLDAKDAFPFSIGVYADGMPHPYSVDANTDSALWRESKTLDSGALATTFGNAATSNVGIMRQMFVKYSGRGKTLRLTITGESQSDFAVYSAESRYRVLPNKQ